VNTLLIGEIADDMDAGNFPEPQAPGTTRPDRPEYVSATGMINMVPCDLQFGEPTFYPVQELEADQRRVTDLDGYRAGL
jgi:hypothetical protein